MSNPASTEEILETDAWVKASWEAFTTLADDPNLEEGRFYYDQGCMRIEMAPLGPAHGQDNTILSNVITLFGTPKNIWIKGYTNTSFWRKGVRASQPDLAFYIGDLPLPPRSNTPVNVEEFGAPTLAIESGASSFKDDLGAKRLLYEQLGVKEYWVVNVEAVEVIAFDVNQGRSGRIYESQVLPGLKMSLIEEALKRSQSEDDGAINRWLIQCFS
jgi:Uma2 family endonuclease